MRKATCLKLDTFLSLVVFSRLRTLCFKFIFCVFCDFFGYSLIMTVTMFVLCFFWSIPVSIQLLGPTNRSNGYAWSNMDYGNTEMSTEGLLSKKCYHILLVTFCFRGHFNPASGESLIFHCKISIGMN